MYLAGIDGGGSKTKCIIGNEKGEILAEGNGGPADYGQSGLEITKASIVQALTEAVNKLNIKISDLDFSLLGLSNADQEQDFVVLEKLCKEIFNNVPFKVMNDTWIGLKAGNPEYWGIVCIFGTGGALAGRTKDGKKEIQLRNIDFEYGSRGGGVEIVKLAFHYAFRADEQTGLKTRLVTEIPLLLGLNNMEEVTAYLRINGARTFKCLEITILVCRLANEEDIICQNILIELGTEIGKMAGGLIKRLELEKEEVPVILIGSVFCKSESPLLLDSYTMELHRAAPFAKIIISKDEPVIGAYKLALEYIKSK